MQYSKYRIIPFFKYALTSLTTNLEMDPPNQNFKNSQY